ncbi:amidohydrolase family protein [Paralcaligenes ureilyticus]|uniref:Putative TIM-barrel fold metal-dependent hydrolase n=1 Tax=Paralcaligenes ureilyticus TaxID=627131 RepID=A0A4R3MGP1_9BURK|nr:amidohydrolase family protein [Paralcaligenes ureilyticus]TCT10815.1 putative TIM-barrel fold metal-dependent hydrolase [Paralcaligenes ureilyticus]
MKLPAQACDCHVHLIGPIAQYPMNEDRHYTPGPAGLDALIGHMHRLSLDRVVLIQPSVYATDNRCLLGGLRRLQGKARGVAVLADDISDTDLVTLSESGVRGLRINLESADTQDPDAVRNSLKKWSKRLSPLSWHIQIYASLNVIDASLGYMNDLAVPVVLDHFAMASMTRPMADPKIQHLLQAVRNGNVYVKLSASYRVAAMIENRAPAELARALLDANPQRILWGSDWPHTNREPGKAAGEVSAYRPVSPESLRQELFAFLPTPELLHQVLVENPARLYGF